VLASIAVADLDPSTATKSYEDFEAL